jgi:GTPase KRas protein
MLGSSKVGKTALGVKFVQRTFVLEYDPTIEDTLRKTIEIDGTNITFDIFDTSGAEEYKAIQDQYIRAGDGFLLVYSVTDKESFEKCEETYQRILRIKDVDSVPVVLVGNNIDSAGRVVSVAEGEELAKQNGWGFFETSAKDNINVDNAFIAISRRVSNNRHRMDARPVKKK